MWRLSGIHDAVGVSVRFDRPWRIRCGGLAAFGGYGISHVSSPDPAFRIRRICLPSGENLTLGVLKRDRDANGAGSYGFSAAPCVAVPRPIISSAPTTRAASARPSRETEPLPSNSN